MNQRFSETSSQVSKFKPPRGVLLFGLPGTGKSLLAKTIIDRAKVKVTIVRNEDTAISSISSAFNLKEPNILFIDEIDTLCETSKDIIRSIILGTDNENSRTFIIACTNRPEIIDLSLRRPGRLDEEIELPPPKFNEKI